MTTEETLRDQAAVPVILRIQADIDGASSRLQPLLKTVKELLFDKSFNVSAIWLKHGIRDRNASSIFRELDTTPRDYILNARMETAERLLLATNVQVHRIARLVGYSNNVSFRKAFRRWKGMTATEVRKRAGFECREGTGFDEAIADGLAGRLSSAQMVELASRLKVVMLGLQSLEKGLPHELDSLLRDPAKVEPYQVSLLVLPRLAGLSFEDQRQVILWARPFSTSALFDALHQRSRAEGRKDRRRGVELSLLALDSVETNAQSLGDLYHVLRPQAWAWLGNAHRLDLDFLAADRALDQALGALRHTEDSFAAGIVHLSQGTLRTFQRRHDEAVRLFDVALPAFEEVGAEEWQIRTLIQRAASLDYAEHYEDALATLTRVSSFPGSGSKDFSVLLAYNAAATLVKLGRLEQAKLHLASLDGDYRSDTEEWRHQWLEARIEQESGEADQAEKKYITAVQSLEDSGESLYRSLVLLDLAVMYAEQDRSLDVIRICKSIYPVFESLKIYEETLASVRLLGQAIADSRITVDLLRDLRASFLRDPLAYTKTS